MHWFVINFSFCNLLNTVKLRQYGHLLVDDFFRLNFFCENCYILIEISLKLIPKVPITNNPALVQIMAWCLTGVNTLSELVMA